MGTLHPGHGQAAGPGTAAARARLVRLITLGGGLTDPRWRAAFDEVPRDVFVPSFYDSVAGGYEQVSADDPDPRRRGRWLRGVYRDGPLATRIGADGALVSSSSQPSLMALMLEALDVEDGCRVLEIGTGSGYNAALLAHRLGDRAVTTMDLEEEITATARERLAAAGYRPEVVTGDGALGCPRRAPFDRIIATCSLGAVPLAWPRQCVAGAKILAPMGTGLIALRVARDGGPAEGHFLPTPAYFVPLRTPDASAGGDTAPDVTGRGVPRHALAEDRFQFLLSLCGGSLPPQEAYALWRRERRPGRERYGVTVAGDRQWTWLDSPGGPYVWETGGQPNGA
ncbi:methyltransferase domain-containing protein [Streptomyces pinistramenti]|uniref:methyltransferase domain-containing protein n=1 Tax=Streptomyces pinistramenti TaxID=2884812 RepID=UPI001D061A6A|nr:methyltransferase domain-containing protein [Streptomyces pinistramenti]MCB5912421.1 methyltransferase domain-containing protein [Streptomyces pinistramenti]